MNSAAIEASLQTAMSTAGLVPPDTIHADGQLHRFSAAGKRSDKSGWYVLHSDGLAAGVFGCWRTGLTETWCSKPTNVMSQAERDALRQQVHLAKAQRDATLRQQQQSAQLTANERWDAAMPVVQHQRQHPYLITKGVPGYGLRAEGDMLLVPMRDTEGTLHSVQTIAPGGSKRFMAQGRVRACYCALGTPSHALVICEGWATAASIRVATGLAVAAAFSAVNLAPVAHALRRKFPALPIILAADDDHATEGNPGITAARMAAMSAGGFVVAPQFSSDRPRKATDFNDLFTLTGAEAVRECFAEVMEGIGHEL